MKIYRVEVHTGGACDRLLPRASWLVLGLMALAVQPAIAQTVEVDKSGNLTVGGDLTVKGKVANNLTVGGDLTVNGKVPGNLTVGQDLTVDRDLKVNGKVLGNLTVGGDLNVNGKVPGNLTVGGDLKVNGKVPGNLTVDGDLKVNGKVPGDLKVDGNIYLTRTHLVYNSTYGVIDWGPGSFFFRTLSSNGVIHGKDASGKNVYTDRMSITNDGLVNIPGTLTVGEGDGKGPTTRMAKFEVRGDIGDQTWEAFNYYARGNIWDHNTHASDTWARPQPYSIYADRDIGADKFIAFSDARIKNILGRSDGAADLKTLLQIEVTNYRYKDVAVHGDGQQKKVIAQQVETVFPQAVGKHTDVVPDIYKMASLRDGWVELTNDLKTGDRVKLISEGAQGIYTVAEATAEGFRTNLQSTSDRVFVYGREVNDFRTVDYDAIAMLNVSATQQIKKEKDAEINALQLENEKLRARIEALESRDKGLDARIAAIQAMLSGRKTSRPDAADNQKGNTR